MKTSVSADTDLKLSNIRLPLRMNRSEEVRPKVEAFEKPFSEIKKYMRWLMSIVDKGEGIAGAFRILGYSTTSGTVLLTHR